MQEEIMPNCGKCSSKFCGYGLKGERANKTQILFVANMLDARIFEKDLLGTRGHYQSFLASDSGKALQNILAHPMLSLTLEDIYFTNIFKGFLEGRMPTQAEYQACREIFNKQLNEFQPKAIVAMGNYAYGAMFPKGPTFDEERGRILVYKDIPTLVTYHPSTILKMPQQHRLKLVDFIKSARAH